MPLKQLIVPGFSQLVKLTCEFNSAVNPGTQYETKVGYIPLAVDKDSGDMGGYIAPYNEYYMVL